MPAPSARETALLNLLLATFPDHRVVGALGRFDDVSLLEVLRPPAIVVSMDGWRPARDGLGQAGGGAMWTIRVIEAELRSPSIRRFSLLDTAGLLRAAIAGRTLAPGNSPLLPSGGNLEQAGNPAAVWAESFVEYLPGAGLIRPTLAASVIFIKQLDVAIAAGTNPLPSLTGGAAEPAIGDLLIMESVDRAAREFLGHIVDIGDGVEVERAPGRAYATGARIYRLSSSIRIPVTRAPGSGVTSVDNAHTVLDLAGGRHKSLLAPPRMATAITFAPIATDDARDVTDYLAAHRGLASLLFADEDGCIHAASLGSPLRAESAAEGLVALILSMALSDSGAMQEWEVSP